MTKLMDFQTSSEVCEKDVLSYKNQLKIGRISLVFDLNIENYFRNYD
jgi:hypothetical protein